MLRVAFISYVEEEQALSAGLSYASPLEWWDVLLLNTPQSPSEELVLSPTPPTYVSCKREHQRSKAVQKAERCKTTQNESSTGGDLLQLSFFTWKDDPIKPLKLVG